MTGRDLLCAIAGIDDGIVLASGQFSAVESSIKADQKRMRQRFAAIGIAAVICIVVFGAIKFMPKRLPLFTPSGTTELQTPGVHDPSESGDISVLPDPGTTTEEEIGTTPSGERDPNSVKETEVPSSITGNNSQTSPTSNSDQLETQMPATETPTTATNHETPTDTSDVPSLAEPSVAPSTVATTTVDIPDAPREVYQDVIVDYATAREKFGYPIKSCGRSDFTNYRAVIVCMDGDINASGAYCAWVTYVFTNGSIDLRDQNRMADGITPTGNAYEYQGRTFYVHLPEFNGDRVRVEFFPTGKSGIAYQAFFDRQADVNGIMDLILSIEI